MVFFFNGTPSGNVNIVGGVNTVPLTLARATRNSNGSTTIYTVPAGKVAYLFFANMPNIAANNLAGNITANGNGVADVTSLAAGINTNPLQLANGLTLTAGQIVVLNVTNYTAGTLEGCIGYYEVAV